jgi:hypothetical protein
MYGINFDKQINNEYYVPPSIIAAVLDEVEWEIHNERVQLGVDLDDPTPTPDTGSCRIGGAVVVHDRVCITCALRMISTTSCYCNAEHADRDQLAGYSAIRIVPFFL